MEESSPTIDEGPKPVLPLRVGALLTVTPSLRVRVSARADALQIRAPFGDLTIPYGLIMQVARDEHDRVRMDLAGAMLQLDLPDLPDMAINYLLDLLEGGRISASLADTRRGQPQHPE